ncbi:MAG: hypothetical protein GC165_05480 [Armatimonadetes bacterium]|nr:hypothetical protein [Armatimonadota bacterium]
MRSWVYTFVGFVGLLGALHLPALGQDQGQANPGGLGGGGAFVQDLKGLKEVKFRFDWSTDGISKTTQPSPYSSLESVTLSGFDGMTMMTTNPVSGENKYRRFTIHSGIQSDGSYVLNVSVSDVMNDSDREIPRLDTMIRIKPGETKVLQDRISQASNQTGYDYKLTVTQVAD